MALQEVTTIDTRAGELHVYHGHEPWIVDQLIEKSKAERLTDPKSVPRDAAERYVDHDTFNKWVTKGDGGRMPYFAVDLSRIRSDGRPEMAGLVALGRQPYPAGDYPELSGVQANHTYLVRSYGLEGALAKDDPESAFYEGTGMSKRLSQVATGHYAGARLMAEAVELAPLGLEPGVWLETDEDNPARTGLYPNMFGAGEGYKEVGLHYNVAHDTMRAGMVLPLRVIERSGYVVAA